MIRNGQLPGLAVAGLLVLAATGCGQLGDKGVANPAAAFSGPNQTVRQAPSQTPIATPPAASPAASPAVAQTLVAEARPGVNGAKSGIPQGMSAVDAMAAGMSDEFNKGYRDGLQLVNVTATDSTCIPDRSTVTAGKIWIKLKNRGTRISEVYLLTAKGMPLIEVENVAPQKAGAFKVSVKKGRYLIACEPGMAGIQVRTPLTVT